MVQVIMDTTRYINHNMKNKNTNAITKTHRHLHMGLFTMRKPPMGKNFMGPNLVRQIHYENKVVIYSIYKTSSTWERIMYPSLQLLLQPAAPALSSHQLLDTASRITSDRKILPGPF